MPCSITRTPTGSISKVLSSQGVESELYNQIASLPFIQNGEEALEVYLQTESDKIFSKINSLEGVERFPSGEPKISFQVNNKVVTNYKDALLNSAGESVTIGFQGESEFIPLQEVNTSISPDTTTGIINNLILDGFLNPSKVKVGNEFRLQGAGDNLTTITFNNGEALQALNSETNAYTIDNNTLKLKGNAEIKETDITENDKTNPVLAFQKPLSTKPPLEDSLLREVEVNIAEGNKLFNNPLPIVTQIEEEYLKSKGLPYIEFNGISSIDTNKSKVIGKLFEDMEPSFNSKETQDAYNAMIEETLEQYKTIISKGYSLEINNLEPYSNSGAMISDLRNNKRMKIFSTESGFGDEAITQKQRDENPLLVDTGLKDVNGETLLANDIFRFVHDFFGHAKLGNGFGAIGEENAWQVHARMYSPLARRAMTTETRGQNSWVNFSGVNNEVFAKRDQARKLRKEGRLEEADKLVGEVYDEMSFAEQKVGLLPEWVSDLNADLSFGSELFKKQSIETMSTLLGLEKGEGTKLVDNNGKFLLNKGDSIRMNDLISKDNLNNSEKELLNWYDNKSVKIFGARSMYEGIAMYNTNTKEIVVNVNNPIGAIHLSSQDRLNQVMFHEIIHAYIDKNVSKKSEFNKELSELREVLVNNKSKANPYVQRMIQHIESGNPEEMVTYLLTDSQVAEFMASIPYETENNQNSLWGKFIDIISKVLNGSTLKDAVVNVMDKYAPLNVSGPYSKSDIYQTDNFSKFSEAMSNAMNKIPNNSGQLKILSPQEAKSLLDEGGKLFLTNDGKAGAYVKGDGYMGGLFKDPTTSRTQAAKILQEVRVEAGGKFFDAFGETSEIHLESTYLKNGFIPLIRMDFNEEFADDNWEDTTLRTRPDNVFFVYAPGIEANIGDGIKNNNYEEGYEIAKNFNPETGVLQQRNPLEDLSIGNDLINSLINNGDITPIDC